MKYSLKKIECVVIIPADNVAEPLPPPELSPETKAIKDELMEDVTYSLLHGESSHGRKLRKAGRRLLKEIAEIGSRRPENE